MIQLNGIKLIKLMNTSFLFLKTGTELSSQEIHGQMVLKILPSVQLNQEKISLMRLYFLMKKERFGGMPIVTGPVQPFTAQLLSLLKKEPLIHFQSPMLKK